MDLKRTLGELAPGIVAYATGLSGDPTAGEEAAQEALTVLVEYWRKHGPPDSPRAFVYTVARRVARRALWRRRLFRPLEAILERRRPEPDPETITRWRDDLRHTMRALGCLSTRERDALLLAAAGELDVAEAASIMGLSRSGFKMRVHRARRRLQRHLEKDDGRGREARLRGSATGMR
jgi:RNA polymerase sigma-70 factor (ECF subfamily)